MPGANIFLTNEDVSTPDGLITCKRVSDFDAVLIAGKGIRIMKRLADALGF